MKRKYKWALAILTTIIIINFFSFAGVLSVLKWFVGFTGYIGLFIVVFILDIIFLQPISPSIFAGIMILGGQDPIMVFLIAGLASSLAGLVGYVLGRTFGLEVLKGFVKEEKLNKASKLFNKYSALAIIFGAMTPIPFSLICWMSGISRVEIKKFIIYSFFTRFLGFLILIGMFYLGIDLFSGII